MRSAFRLAFSREPTTEETTALNKALETGSLTDVCRALLNANEFVFVD